MLLAVIFGASLAGSATTTDQWSQAVFAAIMVLTILPQIIGAGREEA